MIRDQSAVGTAAATSAATTAAAIGAAGERAVESALVSAGATLIGRNLRVGRAEIDLLFTRAGETIAVEVKTALAASTAAPDLHHRLTSRQASRVRRAAAALARESALPGEIRVVGALVTLRADGAHIDWWPDLDEARYSGK